nr:unnamed protein product [Brassica rapa]
MEKYGDHWDSVTTIDRKGTYHIMAPTKHPIYENFGVQAFKALLTATPSEEQVIGLRGGLCTSAMIATVRVGLALMVQTD